MFRQILDVLYPLRCAGCAGGPWPFCERCRAELIVLEPPGCRRCGRPGVQEVARCRDCPPAPIDTTRAPFLYTGPARRALLRLKFSGWSSVARALGLAMAAVAPGRADALTWVPLSKARRSARGYDQARALARVVARELGLPARCILRRVRDTPPQATRSGPERRTAMRGAFRCTVRNPPSHILLVDDVLTTGTTAAACAEALLAAGATTVDVLVAARAVSGSLPARCYTRPGSRPSLWLPGDSPR